jgi:hypothetical protein
MTRNHPINEVHLSSPTNLKETVTHHQQQFGILMIENEINHWIVVVSDLYVPRPVGGTQLLLPHEMKHYK